MKNSAGWCAILSFTVLSGFVACGDDDNGNGNVGHAGESSSAGGGGKAGGGGSATTLGGNDQGGAEVGLGGAPTGTAGHDPGPAGAGGEGAVGGAPALALTDAQILLVLDTLNAGEVEVAYAALPHLTEPSAITFAQMMIDEHSAGRNAVLSTGMTLELKPAPSAVQMEMKHEADAMVATLNASQAPSLDLEYMSSQVTAHTEALALLQDLAASADAAALQSLITSLEATVQMHYDEAVTIQSEL